MDVLRRIRDDHRTHDRPLLYLACPYSAEDDALERARYKVAGRTALRLQHEEGIHEVFSPISHPLGLHEGVDVPTTFEAWEEVDKYMIDASYAICVLHLAGWKESVGVTEELRYAKGTIPSFFLDPYELVTFRDVTHVVPALAGNVLAHPSE